MIPPVVGDSGAQDLNNMEERATYQTGVKYSDTKPPIFTMMNQFSYAMVALAARSEAGHEKYKEHDQDWQNFSRVPDAINQYNNGAIRHLLGLCGNETEIGHKAAAAWNLVAALELEIRDLLKEKSLNSIINDVKQL